ncbi:hypothetical protein J2S97_004402 [Arthrobacter oryzae]|jgi:hypothetical protein|nr:hypothetical protein [Arthrobacter oryzae]
MACITLGRNVVFGEMGPATKEAASDYSSKCVLAGP